MRGAESLMRVSLMGVGVNGVHVRGWERVCLLRSSSRVDFWFSDFLLII
jgi:hypothetical protein